jgi:hypothetical protein
VRLSGHTQFVLQWAEPSNAVPGSSGSTNDLDLIIHKSAGGVLGVGDAYNVNGRPIETISFDNIIPNDLYGIEIVLYEGSAPHLKKLLIFGGGLVSNPFAAITNDVSTTSNIYGHANAALAAAVGASDTQSFNFPAILPVVELSTFRGGSPIVLDTTGAMLPMPQIRQKPLLTGPDGISNTFYGSSNRFYGTSASAANVAAVALLVRQANPNLTPLEVYAVLANKAIDMDDPDTANYFDEGYVDWTGYGYVDADRAVDAALAMAPLTLTPSISPSELPTKAPVKPPTKAPEKSPTKAPEKSPTKAPEKPPTKAPVKPPTKAPVKPPTKAPEKPPTRAPVKPPTKAPEKPPTRAPVKPPTKAPEKPPTRAPVKPPTKAPVKPPTKAPVKPPTKAPVKPPTKAPTKAPIILPCSATDVTKPALSCPTRITINTDANCVAQIPPNFLPSATDNCGGIVTVSLVGGRSISGSGAKMISFTATDISGNRANIACPLDVRDKSSLMITCPASVFLSAESQCVADLTTPFAAIVATKCGAFVRRVKPANTTGFILGVTTVYFSTLDAAGQTLRCTANVEVMDADPDGACGTDDVCPGTSIGTEVPLTRLQAGNYIAMGPLLPNTGYTFKSNIATNFVYSTKRTGGCTCAQIITKCGYKPIYKKIGCPKDMMDAWAAKYSQNGKSLYVCLAKYKV